jgi:hypothetical protein
MKMYVGIGATHGLPARVYQIYAPLRSSSATKFIFSFKLSIPSPLPLTMTENRLNFLQIECSLRAFLQPFVMVSGEWTVLAV